MRCQSIALLCYLIIITTFFHTSFDVVAFGEDNSKDLNDETTRPTIETEDLTNSDGFTKIPFNQLNQNLALDPGDIPALPFLPSFSDSEDMNYGEQGGRYHARDLESSVRYSKSAQARMPEKNITMARGRVVPNFCVLLSSRPASAHRTSCPTE